MQGYIFIAYACVGSLFALTGLHQFFLNPDPSLWVNLVWFALQVLPLVIFVPSLMSGAVRSTLMLCLASLLYFVHGVIVCFEPNGGFLGATEIVFALTLCLVTAYIVRKLREQQAQEI